MARMRMIALFDLSAKHHALPLGTGNKSERLLGPPLRHADDSPPVNPIGDLFKTQLWARTASRRSESNHRKARFRRSRLRDRRTRVILGICSQRPT